LVRGVGELWWRRLWQTIQDPHHPLDAALAAAAADAGNEDVRRWVTATVLSALRRASVADGADVAWRVLYARHLPPVDGVLPVLACANPEHGIMASTGRGIAAVLAARDRLDAFTLQVLTRLAELGYQVDSAPLAAWQYEVRLIRSVTERLRGHNVALDEVAITAAAAEIGTVSVGVVEVESPILVEAIRQLHPEQSSKLVQATPKAQRSVLLDQLARELTVRTDERTGAMYFLVVKGLAERGQAPDALRHTLAEYRQGLSSASSRLVADLLSESDRALWLELGARRSSRRPRNPFRKQPR
jgi:hypothetical protein